MRAHCFVGAVLALASLGLAGCAVETTEQDPAEQTDTTGTALRVAETNTAHLAAMHRAIGGRAGVTVAGDHERRMYDFDNTPRIGQRYPYEANLTALENALVVTHSGTLEGKEILWHSGTDCGVTCTVP
jgi:hypothetical protein